jgi:hypothetical protein
MKAIIQEVKFTKEWESKYGKMYNFQVKYDNEVALYSSKYKDQKKFIPGQEAEFTEESKTYTDKNGNEKEYKVIKPLMAGNRQSNFGKALNKEQARYSAMCVSYAKDLVIADKIKLSEIQEFSWILFELVKEMDKSLSN